MTQRDTLLATPRVQFLSVTETPGMVPKSYSHPDSRSR